MTLTVRSLVRSFILSIFVPLLAYAQPTLTTITSTIYNPDGSYFIGTIQVQSQGPVTNNGYPVTALVKTIQVPTSANGLFSIALIPSTTSNPPGTAYQFTLSNGNKWTCQVPDSPSTIGLVPPYCTPGNTVTNPDSPITGLTGGCTLIVGALNGPCKVTVTSTQLGQLTSSVGVPVIPSVTGRTIVPVQSYIHFNFNSIAYTGGFCLYVTSSSNSTLIANAHNNYCPLSAPVADGLIFGNPYSGVVNPMPGLGLNMYNYGNLLTGGNGTVDVYLTYMLI